MREQLLYLGKIHCQQMSSTTAVNKKRRIEREATTLRTMDEFLLTYAAMGNGAKMLKIIASCDPPPHQPD